jgi:hypothetical protein
MAMRQPSGKTASEQSIAHRGLAGRGMVPGPLHARGDADQKLFAGI